MIKARDLLPRIHHKADSQEHCVYDWFGQESQKGQDHIHL
jgi:hypothetical protein